MTVSARASVGAGLWIGVLSTAVDCGFPTYQGFGADNDASVSASTTTGGPDVSVIGETGVPNDASQGTTTGGSDVSQGTTTGGADGSQTTTGGVADANPIDDGPMGFEGGTCDRDSDCPLRGNSTVVCVGHICSYSCQTGFDDCNNVPGDGCETRLDTVTDCGRCRAACMNANGTTSCTNGTCVPTCSGGFDSCDGDPTNGCETDLDTNSKYCGGCGHPCPTASGMVACMAAKCVVTSCPDGLGDCNGMGDDGCETSLLTVNDCGNCGLKCTNAHGSTMCNAKVDAGAPFSEAGVVLDGGAVEAVCAPTCAPGFLDCDLNPNNGCETSLNTDATNCGTCGNVCPAGGGTPNCVAGKCGVSTCSAGLGDCDGVGPCETNLNTSVTNCGKCGHVCSSTNGTPSCAGGVCGIVCASGFGDCNKIGVDGGPPPDDGCETQLNVTDTGTNLGSVPNCGMCGNACNRRAFTYIDLAACAAGTCARTCFSGQADCDNNRNAINCNGSNCGCETAISGTNANNCGACGHVCKELQVDAGTGACAGGVCRCPDTKPVSGTTTCSLAATVSCGLYNGCTCKCVGGLFQCTTPDGGGC